jgi:hypothetical protein
MVLLAITRHTDPLWVLRSPWRSEEHYLGGNRTRLIGSKPLRHSLLRRGNSRRIFERFCWAVIRPDWMLGLQRRKPLARITSGHSPDG